MHEINCRFFSKNAFYVFCSTALYQYKYCFIFIRLHKYIDISVTLNMKLPMQEFVHSPYPNVAIISFKRSQHVYLMILINSIVLKYVNTFSCYIH